MFLIGFFNTLDSIKYGMDKKKRPYYGFTPLIGKFHKVKITYSGKQKGKLLAQIKVKDTDSNFPIGQIVNVVGKYSNENILNLLKLASEHKYNSALQKNIKNIILPKYDEEFVTIDPDNSTDIDDGFYLNYPNLDIIIACPYYFLDDKEILEKYSDAVSSRYYSKVDHLWGEELNQKASLLENNKTVLMVLHYHLEKEIFEIKFYQGENKHQLTYDIFDKLDDYNEWKVLLKKHFNFTNSKELVQEIMILSNKKFTEYLEKNNAPILYRKFKVEHNFDSLKLDKSIIDIFNQRKSDSAEYTLDKSTHELLEGSYSHFTSPLRRWVDCYHQMLIWNISNNKPFEKMKIDVELINHKFSKIKKFHREFTFLENNKNLLIDEEINYQGYIFNLKNNFLEVWCPKIRRFIKVELIHSKLLFQLDIQQKENSWIVTNNVESYQNLYKIGDIVNFYLIKSNHLLPSKYIIGKIL